MPPTPGLCNAALDVMRAPRCQKPAVAQHGFAEPNGEAKTDVIKNFPSGHLAQKESVTNWNPLFKCSHTFSLLFLTPEGKGGMSVFKQAGILGGCTSQDPATPRNLQVL